MRNLECETRNAEQIAERETERVIEFYLRNFFKQQYLMSTADQINLRFALNMHQS